MFQGLLRRLTSSNRNTIQADQLQAALQSGEPPVLIDIRSAAEFEAAHLPGAIHVPMDRLAEGTAALNRSRPVVVY